MDRGAGDKVRISGDSGEPAFQGGQRGCRKGLSCELVNQIKAPVWYFTCSPSPSLTGQGRGDSS